ncbi:hypothetical protein Acr_27g0006480 [Actinidia rufa]|uniref:CCHC-type domain-containing protein n=1 Tax=Actinidia rufa TaxID=165716 RepID=A0A7J0H784_9ERIC|nr:hypothetical protein Acr_27g0006480 [Actinidia rufa]
MTPQAPPPSPPGPYYGPPPRKYCHLLSHMARLHRVLSFLIILRCHLVHYHLLDHLDLHCFMRPPQSYWGGHCHRLSPSFYVSVLISKWLFLSSIRNSSTKPRRNGVRTRPHAPFEDRRVRSVSATRPGRSHALPRARGRTPRARTRQGEAATRLHAPGDSRTCGHALSRAEEGNPRAARQRSCHAPHARTRQGRLVSEGSRERGRGQGRGHHRGIEKGRWRSQARGRTVRCFYCDQEGHIKRDCPKYKAQVQSSDTAETAVMADDDEIEVLLAASKVGKSDWMANNTASRVVGRWSVRFCMANGRSVTLTEVRHVPNLRKNLISIGMLDAKGCRFDASGGILRVSKGNKEMLWGKKTRGLYDWRECPDKRSYCPTWVQWMSIEKLRERRPSRFFEAVQRKGAATPKRVSFALDLISGGVLSPIVRTREERWSHDNSQSDVLCGAHPGGGCGAPWWGSAGHLGEKVQALRCGGAYTSVGSGVAF